METDVLLRNRPEDGQSGSGSQHLDTPTLHAVMNGRGTPVGVTTQYNSINSDGQNTVPSTEQNPYDAALSASVTSADLGTYKRRWYILFVFSFLALIQGGLCNVWTVIAESAEVAFGWSDEMVTLMQGWLYAAFLITMFPASLLMDRKGIRWGMLASAFAIVLGTVARCITTEPPYVTWLAHIGHILNGMASPVMYTAGPVISALWFPPHQRATATAVATVAGFAGNAACFLEGPLLVLQPMKPIRGGPHPHYNASVIKEIKEEIIHCRYVECAICTILFMAIIVYFPSKPPKSPSRTAAMAKVDFRHGFWDLFKRKNANFWLVALPYGFVISIYSVWTALFAVNLASFNVGEQQAGWLGFYGTASGCIAAVVVGRIADVMVGHMKPILLCMNVGAVLSTFTFILIAERVIPYSDVALYVCCVIQGIFCNGSIPLFYELSIETTYPVAEVATSAVLNILYNILPLFFLAITLLPTLNWMNWVMYGSVLLAFPMLLGFKEHYRRLTVDNTDTNAISSDSASVSSRHIDC